MALTRHPPSVFDFQPDFLALLWIRQDEPARARKQLELYIEIFPEDTRTRELLRELEADPNGK
jgi:hypothetical protein